MADVSFTAASVVAGSGAAVQLGTLGEDSVTQGMVLYQSSSDNEWYIADCTDSSSDAAAGIALGAGSEDQQIAILTGGTLTCDNLSLSAAGDAGVYVLSAAGKICPAADLAEDDYLTIVGVAKAATSLEVKFVVSGVQIVA